MPRRSPMPGDIPAPSDIRARRSPGCRATSSARSVKARRAIFTRVPTHADCAHTRGERREHVFRYENRDEALDDGRVVARHAFCAACSEVEWRQEWPTETRTPCRFTDHRDVLRRLYRARSASMPTVAAEPTHATSRNRHPDGEYRTHKRELSTAASSRGASMYWMGLTPSF